MQAAAVRLAPMRLVGKVVSVPGQMAKTAKVEVVRVVPHAVTGKEISLRKRYLVQDDSETHMPGDIVRIEHTRKLSKRKYFKIIEDIHLAERYQHPSTGEIRTKFM